MAAHSAVDAYFEAAGVSKTQVQKCHYELRRSVDEKGRPAGITKGGVIVVEIVSSATDTALAGWMVNSYKEASGSIEFKDIDGGTQRTVKFEKARCIGYSERFDKTPDIAWPEKPAMTLTLTISAEKISISDALHDNKWSDDEKS